MGGGRGGGGTFVFAEMKNARERVGIRQGCGGILSARFKNVKWRGAHGANKASGSTSNEQLAHRRRIGGGLWHEGSQIKSYTEKAAIPREVAQGHGLKALIHRAHPLAAYNFDDCVYGAIVDLEVFPALQPHLEGV